MAAAGLVEIRELSFRYRGNPGRVFGPVSLRVEAGDRVGFAGESGSGKTSTLELAAGLTPRSLEIVQGSAATQGRVAYIPQESSNCLSPFLAALEHVEGLANNRSAASRLLAELGLADTRRQQAYPSQLSGGERQRVLVAMALAMQPDVILADEPTANLDPKSAAAVLRALGESPAGLLISSHREQVFARLGCNSIQRLAPKPELPPWPTLCEPSETTALEVHGLRFEHQGRDFWMRQRPAGFALQDVSLTLHAGELVALTGPSGSGKSTLARCLAADKRTRVQLVEQEPSNTLNPNQRLQDALGEANPQADPALALQAVGLPGEWRSRRASELSEGQRARVAIARALAAGPELLILDESLSGLDEGTERSVFDAILAAQRTTGMACLIIAHEPRFPVHRTLRMSEGRLVA